MRNILTTFCLSIALFPQWLFPQSSNINLAGEWIHNRTFNAVYINGNLAYTGAGRAMYILDISNPSANASSMRALSEAVQPMTINWIKTVNAAAYIADADSGLRIVNVLNPYQPFNEGAIYTNGKAKCVDVSGNYAFVAADTAGLRIIDVSSPNAPTQVAYYDLGNTSANAVTVFGNFAYIAYGNSGLRILDISNPLIPVQVSSMSWNQFTPQNVVVSGNYAYVIDDSLHIINISNPAAPVQVSVSNPFNNQFGYSLMLSGNYVYTEDLMFSGYDITDVSNPASPQFVGGVSMTTSSNFYYQGIGISGGRAAFIDNSSFGIRSLDIYDISNQPSIALLGKFLQTEYNADVCSNGNYVYVAQWTAPNSNEMISIYDISTPLYPTEVGVYNDTVSQNGNSEIVAGGNYIFMSAAKTGTGNSYGFKVIDVSNPLNPVYTGKFNINNASCKGISVSGNYVYVCFYSQGFKVVDVSNPQQPVLAGSVNLSGGFQAVEACAVGNYAYVTDNASRLHVVDCTNPNSPLDIGSCALPANGTDVQYISGNYVYVACGAQGLRVVDISNPNAPVVVGSYPSVSNGTTKLILRGSMVYITDIINGIQSIDVSNPSNPLQIGYYYGLAGLTRNIFADQYHIYAVSDNGLYIFNDAFITSCQTGSLRAEGINLFPDPNNGYFTIVNESSENSFLEVYSLIGEKIYECVLQPGNNFITVPTPANGVYFAKTISGSGVRIQKFIVKDK